jgi:carboxymethylenebutenolidase
MCDDDTEAENALYLRHARMNRRQWNIGSGATLATLLAGCGPKDAPTTPPSAAPDSEGGRGEDPATAPPVESTTVQQRMVTIDTPDGSAEAIFVAPAKGTHPAVLMWPDIAGLRDAFVAMATRLAETGYAVLAVNPYYRSSKLPILKVFDEWRTEEGRAKIRPMVEALSSEGIAKDGAAFVAWLDQQPEVDKDKRVGSTGYCMSGSFTFRTAAAAPERVGAIASFHGGGLVSEEADSPHQLFPQMKAAALVCIASNDDERQPEAKEALRAAAQEAQREAEIEVYPAQHGWCVLDSPVYDEVQAERAWARMLATFETHL